MCRMNHGCRSFPQFRFTSFVQSGPMLNHSLCFALFFPGITLRCWVLSFEACLRFVTNNSRFRVQFPRWRTAQPGIFEICKGYSERKVIMKQPLGFFPDRIRAEALVSDFVCLACFFRISSHSIQKIAWLCAAIRENNGNGICYHHCDDGLKKLILELQFFCCGLALTSLLYHSPIWIFIKLRDGDSATRTARVTRVINNENRILISGWFQIHVKIVKQRHEVIQALHFFEVLMMCLPFNSLDFFSWKITRRTVQRQGGSASEETESKFQKLQMTRD